MKIEGVTRERRDGQKWVGALPAKIFQTKPMYFNALKSGEAINFYNQKEARQAVFSCDRHKKGQVAQSQIAFFFLIFNSASLIAFSSPFCSTSIMKDERGILRNRHTAPTFRNSKTRSSAMVSSGKPLLVWN